MNGGPKFRPGLLLVAVAVLVPIGGARTAASGWK